MKKILVIFALLAVSFASVNAQENLKWGATLGMNSSNFSGDAFSSKVGFHAGVKAEVGLPQIAEGVYLDLGALLSLKGAKVNLGSYDIKYNPCYLEIPVHMGYKYAVNENFAVFGNAGPYVAIGLFGKVKTDGIESSDPSDNVFDGKNGSDTISFEKVDSSVDVTIDLKNNTATSSASGTDTLTSIENVIGGAGNDTIKVSTDVESNILDGGSGNDTVSYEYYTTGVIRDLSNTTTAQDDDILKGFENIIGGTGDDSFKGNSLNNIFNGNSGNDTVDYTNATAKIVANLNSTTKTVVSGSDNDTLLNIDKIIGSNYSDTFYSDLSGNNTFVGGTQADGTAADVVDYSQMIVSDATKDYVYLDLSTSSATVKQNSQVTASDTFSEIEKFVLTSGNDTIKGNDQANTMDGGAGSDTVRYDYLNSGNSVIVNFNTASASTTIAGDIDTYVSIENAYGSLGDDTFIMNATDNIENIVDGGIDGVDTISYQNYTTKVTVNLEIGRAHV